MPPGIGGAPRGAGDGQPFEMAGPIRTPHFLFSGERKENGPFTVQKKRAFLSGLVENYGLEEVKREVYVDLSLRLFPLPLLRCAKGISLSGLFMAACRFPHPLWKKQNFCSQLFCSQLFQPPAERQRHLRLSQISDALFAAEAESAKFPPVSKTSPFDHRRAAAVSVAESSR